MPPPILWQALHPFWVKTSLPLSMSACAVLSVTSGTLSAARAEPGSDACAVPSGAGDDSIELLAAEDEEREREEADRGNAEAGQVALGLRRLGEVLHADVVIEEVDLVDVAAEPRERDREPQSGRVLRRVEDEAPPGQEERRRQHRDGRGACRRHEAARAVPGRPRRGRRLHHGQMRVGRAHYFFLGLTRK